MKALSLALSVALLIPAVSTQAASGNVAAQVVAQEDDNAMNAYIIQKLLASIKRSGCDFEFEGSINNDQTNLDFLDVDCTVQLTDKEDIRLSLLDTEEETPSKAKDQSFKTIVNISSKSMYLRLLGKKDGGKARLTARFYSHYDSKKRQWVEKPVEISVAVLNGNQVMNSELVAIRLAGIDLNITENPQNRSEMSVIGGCDSEKKIYNFITNKFEYRQAHCFLEGVYEPNKTTKFKFGFKNAKNPGALP